MLGPIRFLTAMLGVSSSSSSNNSDSDDCDSLRNSLLDILQRHRHGHLTPDVRSQFATKLNELAVHDDRDPQDVLFTIGSSVFGVEVHHHKPESTLDNNNNNNNNNSNEQHEPPVIVSFEYMKEFMKDVFLSYGVEQERAELCADVLIESDRRGIDSHGLGRLKPIYCDRMDQGILEPNAPIQILKETDTTALVDGNLGIGLYIGPYCMQLAIDKAKKHGVGFVVAKRSTHYGIAGYYVTQATSQGCIGWSGTNARPSIAPTFGVEPMLGTNPLCFGIPTDEDFPFVIDCATSINQRGKIERYGREGVDTPKGVVIDDQGLERTDTEGILRDMVLGKCALNPVGGAGDKTGGYKGYSWATVVELMSTAFQSGPFGEDVCGVDRKTGKKKPMPLGHYFMAIDIEALCPLETFKENAGNLLRAIRASKKSPLGPGRIWTAGEPEHDARVAREAQGGMVVAQVLQQNMLDLRETRPGLKEKYPTFPWEE
jgi:LDH2 family malate/lactate/ureidoglycolate dehydrogenase